MGQGKGATEDPDFRPQLSVGDIAVLETVLLL